MKIRPASQDDQLLVANAIAKLREARDMLVSAGAPRAADKVREALKSAEGAQRHVGHRVLRTDWQAEAASYATGSEILTRTINTH